MWNDPIIKVDGDIATVGCKCCGNRYEIKMTPEQIHKVQECDGLIQNIIPNVKPEIRELFISGWCPDCWRKKMGFALEEEQDEDDNA